MVFRFTVFYRIVTNIVKVEGVYGSYRDPNTEMVCHSVETLFAYKYNLILNELNNVDKFRLKCTGHNVKAI